MKKGISYLPRICPIWSSISPPAVLSSSVSFFLGWRTFFISSCNIVLLAINYLNFFFLGASWITCTLLAQDYYLWIYDSSWSFFAYFSPTLKVLALSSGLHGFWWEIHNSHHSPVCNVSLCISVFLWFVHYCLLSLVLNLMYISGLFFFLLILIGFRWASWIHETDWCLSSLLESSWPSSLQLFLLFYSLSPLLLGTKPIYFIPLHTTYRFEIFLFLLSEFQSGYFLFFGGGYY